jgi:hypothetical protein
MKQALYFQCPILGVIAHLSKFHNFDYSSTPGASCMEQFSGYGCRWRSLGVSILLESVGFSNKLCPQKFYETLKFLDTLDGQLSLQANLDSIRASLQNLVSPPAQPESASIADAGLKPGAADLAFLIPRDLFDNHLGEFASDLIQDFSEAITGHAAGEDKLALDTVRDNMSYQNIRSLNALGGPFGAAGIMGFVVLLAAPAYALTNISSCPANIAAPGNYQITADLACTVIISASGVSLKLNGHVITLPGTPAKSGPDGIDIVGAGRLNHVAVEGPGLIQGASVGISLIDDDYSQVSLVTIKNSYDGIVAVRNTFLTVGSNVIGHLVASGIDLKSCSFSTVAGNDVTGVGHTALGIEGPGTLNITVNNTTLSGSGVAGIVVLDGSGVRIHGNVEWERPSWH